MLVACDTCRRDRRSPHQNEQRANRWTAATVASSHRRAKEKAGTAGLIAISQLAPDGACEKLETNPDGLTEAEAARRLKAYGPNLVAHDDDHHLHRGNYAAVQLGRHCARLYSAAPTLLAAPCRHAGGLRDADAPDQDMVRAALGDVRTVLGPGERDP